MSAGREDLNSSVKPAVFQLRRWSRTMTSRSLVMCRLLLASAVTCHSYMKRPLRPLIGCNVTRTMNMTSSLGSSSGAGTERIWQVSYVFFSFNKTSWPDTFFKLMDNRFNFYATSHTFPKSCHQGFGVPREFRGQGAQLDYILVHYGGTLTLA